MQWYLITHKRQLIDKQNCLFLAQQPFTLWWNFCPGFLKANTSYNVVFYLTDRHLKSYLAYLYAGLAWRVSWAWRGTVGASRACCTVRKSRWRSISADTTLRTSPWQRTATTGDCWCSRWVGKVCIIQKIPHILHNVL